MCRKNNMAYYMFNELIVFLAVIHVGWYVSATPAEYQVSNNCQLPLPSCANLSYYVEHSNQFFTNGAVFYFSEDTHHLNQILNITGVNYLTLQGLGGREVGFHETVSQSKSIVSCANSNTGGIIIRHSSHIVIKNLTITKCGFRYNANTNISLFVSEVCSFTLQQVSVLNSTGVGVVLSNAFNVFISDSSFAFSKMLHYSNRFCFSNIIIVSRLMVTKDPVPSYFTIVRSNFSFGFCFVDKHTFFSLNGTGLSITFSQMGSNNSYATHFNLESLVYYGNAAPNGANFNFVEGGSLTGNYKLAMSNIRSVYANALVQSSISGGCGFRIYQYGIINGEVLIKNSEIAYNVAEFDGSGGLELFFNMQTNNRVKINNCSIHNNIGVNTSGVSIIKYGLSTKYHVVTFKHVSIYDNAIKPHNNYFYTAVVHLYNVAAHFNEINISNHLTMGIYSYKSYIYFRHDNNYFVNNSGLSGGAMGLYQSYLFMHHGTRVYFHDNHAQYFGGAVFLSQASNNIPVPCFYGCIYIDLTCPAVMFSFFNNSAGVAGDAVYGVSSIRACEWACTNTFDEIFNVTLQNNGLSIMSSDPLQVCFCEPNEPPNCEFKQTTQKVIPGSSINISVAAVGFKNGLTSGPVKVTEYSNARSHKKITTFGLTASCTNITYTFDVFNSSITSLLLYITLENSYNPLNDESSKIISVTVEPCPNGFQLSSINGKCICRSELNDVHGISCDVDSKMISKESDNAWIGFDNSSNCLITYQPCPFDYCELGNVTISLTDPSPQCALNRAGLLCGQCADGLSLMLGTNQCGECTNDYFSLIVVFALAGIALIAFLIALNLTVSVGTINSVIFYANIVKLYEPLFFPKGPVIILSQFISWINLDLGIQTCFLQNMNSCSKTGLQFVFPFYIWLIIILISVMARYSIKIARLVGTNIISVLATMILLSYTKLLRTVLVSLYIADISCSTRDNEETIVTRVWYIDSSIRYLQGCHLPLFVVSLVVLCLVILPSTIYLSLIPIVEKNSMCCKKVTLFVKPFFDAYCGPYKDKYRFWTGFLLFVRLVLALVVSLAAESSINVLVAVIILIICIIFLLKGIYRTFPLVILDIFFLMNLLMIAHLSMQMQFQNDTGSNGKFQVAIIVFVSFAFIVFCSIISFHIWKCINQYEVMQKFITKCRKKGASTTENNPDGTVLNVKAYPSSTTVGCNINDEREPLLFSSNESKSASHDANLFD